MAVLRWVLVISLLVSPFLGQSGALAALAGHHEAAAEAASAPGHAPRSAAQDPCADHRGMGHGPIGHPDTCHAGHFGLPDTVVLLAPRPRAIVLAPMPVAEAAVDGLTLEPPPPRPLRL